MLRNIVIKVSLLKLTKKGSFGVYILSSIIYFFKYFLDLKYTTRAHSAHLSILIFRTKQYRYCVSVLLVLKMIFFILFMFQFFFVI